MVVRIIRGLLLCVFLPWLFIISLAVNSSSATWQSLYEDNEVTAVAFDPPYLYFTARGKLWQWQEKTEEIKQLASQREGLPRGEIKRLIFDKQEMIAHANEDRISIVSL